MVLHYAEDPPGVLAEVARVLRPGGRLIVIDLAQHGRDDLLTRLAHRWPGFSDDAMRELLEDAGMQQGAPRTIAGPLAIRLWPATRAADAPDRAAARTGRLNAHRGRHHRPRRLHPGHAQGRTAHAPGRQHRGRTVAGAGGAQRPAAALGNARGAACRLPSSPTCNRSSTSTTKAAGFWSTNGISTTSPAPTCGAPMPTRCSTPRSSSHRRSFIERGVPIAAVMDGVLAAMRDAAGEHGISAGLLVIAQRHRSEAEALRLLDQVMPWADRIAGFGLGGAELGNPPSRVRALLPRLPRARLPRHRTCGRGGAGVLCARGDRTAGGGPHRSRQCLPRRSGAGARTGGARHSTDGLPALECPAEGGAVAGGASAARHAGRRALCDAQLGRSRLFRRHHQR